MPHNDTDSNAFQTSSVTSISTRVLTFCDDRTRRYAKGKATGPYTAICRLQVDGLTIRERRETLTGCKNRAMWVARLRHEERRGQETAEV